MKLGMQTICQILFLQIILVRLSICYLYIYFLSPLFSVSSDIVQRGVKPPHSQCVCSGCNSLFGSIYS